MPKQRPSEPPEPPPIPFEEGRRRIAIHIGKGEELLNSRPISETKYGSWSTGAFETIKRTFGPKSDWLSTFNGQMRFSMATGHSGEERYLEAERAEKMQQRVQVLKDISEHIDLELSATNTGSPGTFWDDLDPDIVRVAKDVFEDGHFDKAVLSAFIEINDRVKRFVLQKTKKELDGASLMNTAFSLSSPIVKLTDLSSQAERDVQLGFMQIFAGSMTGIRNPHAHVNLAMDASRGRHFLYLASLLMKTLKEAHP